MRNLLGRLNGRSTEELSRIARFWRVPTESTGPKHRLVGGLYRTMTDTRGGRDAWDRLDDQERQLVTLLAGTSEGSLAIGDLARRLGVTETAAHEIAARLYRAGIIARVGDDDPLPIGAVPRLFLPIEIGQLFRRIRDERELGDVSGRTLPTLLGLLDDTELEEAAGYWGFKAIPGLHRRDDLIARIGEGVADPDRRRAVVQSLARRPEAARLWDAVLPPRPDPDAPAPVPYAQRIAVPLADAVATAGLTPPDTDPAAELRLRSTLSDLESRLLVWHTYDASGNRFLFVPAEIRDPKAIAAHGIDRPEPVATDQVQPDPWHSPDSLAWDLLTVVRALGSADAPVVATVETLPRPWLRWLNSRLWWRGDDTPPPGYLAFLAAFGQDEGILRVADGPSGTALTSTAAIRGWRDRSFPEQTAQLRLRWLATTGWPEGAARSDLAIEGADWRGFRRRLLAHLGELIATDQATATPPGDGAKPDANATTGPDAGPWYAVEDLAQWLAALDTDILGDTFSAASAAYTGTTEPERRRAAIADTIAGTLTTALAWFGLVELGSGSRGRRLVRVSPAALAPTTTERPDGSNATTPRDGSSREAPISLAIDGTIRLRQPSPVRVWSLLTFADPLTLGEISTYRLTEAALGRALAAGFELGQVTDFLTRQSRRGLPEPVLADLQGWSNGFRRVRIGPALTLRPDDDGQIDELVALATAAGLTAHQLPDGSVVIPLPGRWRSPDSDTAVATLTERLRAAGFQPSGNS